MEYGLAGDMEYQPVCKGWIYLTCKDRVYMATHGCIWPLLGQFSGSWPFAAIALVSLGAARCLRFPVPQRYGDCLLRVEAWVAALALAALVRTP